MQPYSSFKTNKLTIQYEHRGVYIPMDQTQTDFWLFGIQLPMQSVPITTDFVSSSLDQTKVYTLCYKVCQWLVTGRWFSPVSSTNKTDRHDIAEILLNVVLNTITLTLTLYGHSKNIHLIFTNHDVSSKRMIGTNRRSVILIIPLFTRFLSAEKDLTLSAQWVEKYICFLSFNNIWD